MTAVTFDLRRIAAFLLLLASLALPLAAGAQCAAPGPYGGTAWPMESSAADWTGSIGIGFL